MQLPTTKNSKTDIYPVGQSFSESAKTTMVPFNKSCFNRNCCKITANRMLIEVRDEVFNVRPDIFEGVDILNIKSCEREDMDRFLEERRKYFWPCFPDKNNKAHYGISLEEVSHLFPEYYTLLAEQYYGCFGGDDKTEGCSNSEQPPPQKNMRLIAIKEPSAIIANEHDDLKGCCIYYLNQCHYTVEASNRSLYYRLSNKEVAANVPIIARQLYQNKHKKLVDFKFVFFLNDRENNTVSLVEANSNERFIVKHLWDGTILTGEQSYPKVFSNLRSVRKSMLDKDMLIKIGSDIDVTPVVSDYNFSCVSAYGLKYDELEFFKMVPYVENSQTLKKAIDEKLIKPEDFNIIVKNMALFLARLHTYSSKVELIKDLSGKCITISAARMHYHPHGSNWLVDRENMTHLFIIDWDRYSDCVVREEDHLSFVEQDIYTCFQDIPDEYKEHFILSYLSEWEKGCEHLSDFDKQQAIAMIKKFIKLKNR